MARSRNIKPGFFGNDLLAEIEPLGRLLFIGLWTIADREGRLENRPKKIKANVLPYDECNIETMLDALESSGFILRYTVAGLKFIQIQNWAKHQQPHIKEVASTIQAPCWADESTVQEPDSHQTCMEQESLIPDSLNLIPDSKKTPQRSKDDEGDNSTQGTNESAAFPLGISGNILVARGFEIPEIEAAS